MTAAPASRPCGSCPYRRDVPSGIWSPEEYAKLPAYDLPTGEQPHGAFFCHQQDGRLCAGWVGCHDMVNNLGLRFVVLCGVITLADRDAALDYTTDVPLFASGREAAEHGMRDVWNPSDRAQRVVARLATKKEDAETVGPNR